MIVELTENIDDIERVLLDPEIYDRIKVDGIVNVQISAIKGCTYVAGYDNGEIFALMLYYKRNTYTTCHVHVLKTHRAKLAVKFCRKALKLRPDNVLYTNIPNKYPDVIRFARYFGFKPVPGNGRHNVYKMVAE